MFRLFVAICLVLSIITVVTSQGPDKICERPPQVDPKSCCNITKTFDRTEYPECFTDEIGNGAGGFRGTNRQRRSPWGGHGDHWDHHGYDHGHFHHGPKFHGSSDWSDRTDSFRQRDSAPIYRQTNNDGYNFRAQQQGNVGFRNEQRDFGFQNEQRDSAYRAIQRDAGIRESPGRLFAGETNMKAFSCQIDCFLNRAGIIKDNAIDRNVALSRLTPIYVSVTPDVLRQAIDKCVDKLNQFKANGLPPPPPGPPGLPGRDGLGGTCPHTGGFFMMCIHHEVFLNCPGNIWTNSNECSDLKNFVEKCRPGRRSAPNQ